MDRENRELHLISNGKLSLTEFADIAALVWPWVTAIHLRERMKTARELLDGIDLLLQAGVPPERLYVNDRADVAAAAGIRGVHLAGHSLEPAQVKAILPRIRIGQSVHSVAEARHAEASGADYVMFGHVFATESKAGLAGRGLAALADVVRTVSIPVIAIGGMTPGNAESVFAIGAKGIAVMSGILGAANPAHAAEAYCRTLKEGGGRDQ
ncbi:thiamine phosphate synthase [Brevibacillus fluminis]|uniref:thiamine phosphate synthase n=1 Tax=Brevibacillus fluminis TaxID=511487 RepID=UPI003F893E6A